MVQVRIQTIEVRQRTKKAPKPSEKDAERNQNESRKRKRSPSSAATYRDGETMGEETDTGIRRESRSRGHEQPLLIYGDDGLGSSIRQGGARFSPPCTSFQALRAPISEGLSAPSRERSLSYRYWC
jgi:hypothetical protein